MAESDKIKILKCEKIVVQDYTELEQKLNNWFLQNKEKNIRFITQSYIPADRTPVNNEGKYEETRSFYLYTIFFEKP